MLRGYRLRQPRDLPLFQVLERPESEVD